MLERQVRIRALACAVTALATTAGSTAWAATCTSTKLLSNQTCCSWRTTSSGVRYCTLWCTGSEICDNTISGLGGNIVDDCTPGVNCPLTSCTAYGTAAVNTSDGECDASLSNLNETCGIQGIAVCYNPATKFNEKGTPFALPGIQGAVSDTLTCDKKGKCTNSLKLQPEDASAVCANSNWQFVSFTASEFKAKSCLCPGGLDEGGACCSTTSRNADGTCSTLYGTGGSVGTPTCMTAFCTVDLSTYDPVTNFNLPYDCHPDTAQTCGGVTGSPCP